MKRVYMDVRIRGQRYKLFTADVKKIYSVRKGNAPHVPPYS